MTPKSKIVIGVDGGGTKTRAMIAHLGAVEAGDLNQAEQTAALSGPSNLAAVGGGPAFEAIKEAINLALDASGERRENVVAICAGLAGHSHESRRVEVHSKLKTLFPLANIEIVPDYIASYSGALSGKPGVIVVSGTGSIAYGENIHGKSHRVGGYGYLIDDSGSGYGVGRSAIAAVLRALDGSGPKTALTQALAEELRVDDFPSIISAVYGGSVDRVRIAGITPIVVRAAMRGDPVAKGIFHTAGEELGRLAVTVCSTLFAKGVPVPISLSGRVWEAGEYVMGPFSQVVSSFATGCVICRPQMNSATGAILRAARLVG
jgi:N-acetylglucosamine kinase-like BadF-type ATPase